MSKIETLIKRFNLAKMQGASCEYLNELADNIQKINMNSYASNTSFVMRRNKVSEFEMQKWKRLEMYAKPNSRTKLFDSAFGSGRDLIIASELGYDVCGCELSEFLYNDFLLAQTRFSAINLVKADMRAIPFSNGIFDIVRHNASFLHMPMIGKGYTVHKCLEESHRILKPDGYLYIYTKEGEGFIAIDTQEGLGARSFQLYNEETLGNLLNECCFEVIKYNHYARERNGVPILWLEAFAIKKGARVC